MKTPLAFLCLFCCVLFMGGTHAQTYYFSVDNEQYEPIQGGQSLVNETWDDPDFTVPIGFNFEFFNETINELTLRGSFTYISLVDEPLADIVSLIILFGADLIDRGWMDDNHQSPIKSAVTGSPGSRVFTLEWDNAGFFADISANGSSTDFVNFQLKLFEENGDIVFHFGPNLVTDPQLAFGGNSGPFLGIAEDYNTVLDVVNGEIILLSGDPLDPDINTTYENVFMESMVPENTVYRFSREITSTKTPDGEDLGLNFFPNPTTGFVHLKNDVDVDASTLIEVYNMNGRLVTRLEPTRTINLNDLPAGIYALKYSSNHTVRSERIIVLPH